jgi:hypothetical protein
VSITTKVVSWKPTHAEVYSQQHYVIKFVSDMRQVNFSPDTQVSPTNKTDRHVIAENCHTITTMTAPLSRIKQPSSLKFKLLLTNVIKE